MAIHFMTYFQCNSVEIATKLCELKTEYEDVLIEVTMLVENLSCKVQVSNLTELFFPVSSKVPLLSQLFLHIAVVNEGDSEPLLFAESFTDGVG